MEKALFVRAEWDEEAEVWVATSDDVPGLVAEADIRRAGSWRTAASHIRGNASVDAPRPVPQERHKLRSHAGAWER